MKNNILVNKVSKKLLSFLLCVIIPLTALATFFYIPTASADEGEFAEITNVIYMIGDGMGHNHVRAGRWLKHNSDDPLVVEQTEYIGELTTRSTTSFSVRGDAPTKEYNMHNVPDADEYGYSSEWTDSAAGGTALASGRKTNNSRIGQGQDNQGAVLYKNIMEAAMEKGMKTGVISSKSLRDATPASFSSHTHDRSSGTNPASILAQQIASGIDVLIGGTQGTDLGLNSDDRALVTSLGYTYIYNADGFNEWNNDEKVFGYMVNGIAGNYQGNLPAGQPTLADITEKSLSSLSKGDNGFVVMIEGGSIDSYAHGRNLIGSITEMVEFDKAIEVAYRFADENPGTIVITTADHETGSLTLPETITSWSQLVGMGSDIFLNTSGNHSRRNVPIYVYGAGADRLITTNRPMENTRVAQFIATELELDIGYYTGDKDAEIIKVTASGQLADRLASAGSKVKISSPKGVNLNTSDIAAIKAAPLTYLDLRDTAFNNNRSLPNDIFDNSPLSPTVLGATLKTVLLPEHILSIGDYAFADNASLERVIFPECLEEIGQYAFKGTKLETVDLPFRLMTLGKKAFDIPTLRKVTAWGNLWTESAVVASGENFTGPSIASDAFNLSYQFTIHVRYWFVGNYEGTWGNTTGWSAFKGRFFALENNAFATVGVAKWGNIASILGEDVLTSKNLRIVTNPSAENTSTSSSSTNVSYLNSTDIAALNTYDVERLDLSRANVSSNRLSTSSFGTASDVTSSTAVKQLREIILPSSLQQIGAYAFHNTRLQSVVIPENVVSVMHRAFSRCRELEYVQFSYNPETYMVAQSYTLANYNGTGTGSRTNSPFNVIFQKQDGTASTHVFADSGTLVIGGLKVYGLSGGGAETQCSLETTPVAFESNLYRVAVTETNEQFTIFDRFVVGGSSVLQEVMSVITQRYSDYDIVLENQLLLENVNQDFNLDFTATRKSYTISITKGEATLNGSVVSAGHSGDIITLEHDVAEAEWRFTGWHVVSGAASIVDGEFVLNSNVVIEAQYERIRYDLDVVYASYEGENMAGETIYLTADERDGYVFIGWEVRDGDVFIQNNTFIMPSSDVLVRAVFRKIYAVTIEGGSYDGVSYVGNSISILPQGSKGREFVEWEVVSGDIRIVSDTFTMPDEDVIIRAVFNYFSYDLTVENGYAWVENEMSQSAKYWQSITLIPSPSVGMRFVRWEIVEGAFDIANNMFYMPDENVVIKGIYENIVYDISISGGSYSGSPTYNSSVTLTPSVPTGKRFVSWNVLSGDVVVAGNSFTMPSKNVAIEAVFEDVVYSVTVTDGSYTGDTIYGATITLSHESVKGKEFKGWEVVSGDVVITNNQFVMPAGDVEIKAVFEKKGGCGAIDSSTPIMLFTVLAVLMLAHYALHARKPKTKNFA